MKAASLAFAVAIVAAGPALAAPTHVARSGHHTYHHGQSTDSRAPVLKTDPLGVYEGRQEIGRDPDPNIRDELGREFYWGG
jgi:hypothetical protein